jgi:hypothetical protein
MDRGISRPNNERSRHDEPTGKFRQLELTKKLLVSALSDAGVSLQQNRSYTKNELQKIEEFEALVSLRARSKSYLCGRAGQKDSCKPFGRER